MDTQERIQWVRGPGDARTRRYFRARAQAAINERGAARARRVLQEIASD